MKLLTWLLFLPLILAPIQPYHGLALADATHPGDLQALGAEWSYDWTPTGEVPMLWSGKPSSLIAWDYDGWILVLNEPNVTTQANMTPSEAVKRIALVRAYYPRSRLVCCGASIWAGAWMREFYALGGRPDAWHMHAYTEEWVTPGYVKMELAALHSLTGGDYWITEYGSPSGSLRDFQEVTLWFEEMQWITRIAPYTNRQDDTAAWAIGRGVVLVNDDGSLTEIGAWYATR